MIELAEPIGLCTSTALQKLCLAIEDELNAQEAQWQRRQTFLSTISQTPDLALRTDNAFHWTSALFVLVAALFLLVAAVASGDTGLGVEGAVLLVVLVINLYVTGWDSKLRHQEVVSHARDVLDKLQDLISSGKVWEPLDYVPLYSPPSGGINVQWTFRDGRLVNLPSCLLVKDDVILLKPGQPAPTKVSEHEVGSTLELSYGESYQPPVPPACNEPKARKPLKPGKFLVKETPYVPILRSCIQTASSRPISSLENKRIMAIQVIERYIMPVVLVFSLVISVIRFAVMNKDHGHWADMIIAIQVSTILPLLSLAFPAMWIFINTYGTACIVTLFHKSKHFQQENLASDYSEDRDAEFQNVMKDEWSWREVWHHFTASFLGTSNHLPRTANLLHCLGHVTSLCCIDKRGILSYPDPTVEKVFFMSGLQDDEPDNGSDSDSVFEEEDEGEARAKKVVSIKRSLDALSKEDHFPEIHTEVLTLSIDQAQTVPGLQFDDKNWERHINSLKPMGLNILLNTCHCGTVDRYSHFLDHVYSSVNHEEIRLALKYSYRSDLSHRHAGMDERREVHVAPRRCLCQLAHLIGFTEQATQVYDLKQQLAMYRLVNGKGNEDHAHLPHKTRSFIKRKIPAPHLLSVCIHDPRTGTNQLLTQGTADLVLSLSTDFWDGSDLCPLTDSERKKVMDFYQRATLSSYCSAFSYQPMVESMANYFDDLYLELPRHNRDLLTSEPESPGVARSSWDVGFGSQQAPNAGPKKGRKYHSLESAMDTLGDIRDSESCYRAQCGQIFIGMVASNYQPKPDIVALIENLDNACIRFVHFSRDQELRSRVFTEKMGLEAGWNCHISLLSEEGSSSVSTSPNTFDTVSRQHSNTSAKSNSHHDTCQVNMDVCNVRVSWQDMAREAKEEKMAAGRIRTSSDNTLINSRKTSNISIESCGDIEAELTKDVHVDFVNTRDVIKEEEEDNVCANKTDGSEPVRISTDSIDVNNMSLDEENNKSEIESLLQDGCTKSPTGSEANLSARRRHISEAPTLGEGIDGDTLSHYTESDTTGGFDISNRAKLPRGIENIRPHLENVDNVPLLVPLFTDVTHATTREMIQIMQDYGEVVCCMGSSVSLSNVPIFTQANVSIGVEPLYPHICLNKDESAVACNINQPDSPMTLASHLICLPCSLSFKRGDHISIIELIKEARGICMAMTNCFSFLMYGLFSICAIQLMASILFMPPPLSGRHVLWLVLIVVPTLSVSLLGSPFQSQLMTYATGKNLKQMDKEVTVLHGFYFISKFMGSVLVSLICFGLILYAFCCQVVEEGSCHVLLGYRNSTGHWNGLKAEHYSFLVLAQNVQTFLLTFYLIVASASFVHRLKSIWKRPPFTNHLWCGVVLALLLFEMIYFVLDVRIWNSMPSDYPIVGLRDIPLQAWILAFVWPIICLTVCEIIKIFEIRVFVRWQKRTKLQFGTKLGMNSPF